MNILQILPELNVGGVETGTVDLARRLVKLGHKAVVVSAGGHMVKELEGAGVIHYQLPVQKKSLFAILKMVPKLVEVIRKEEIDIVHARSRVPAWIAYLACRKTLTPFVTTCHGYYRKHPFSLPMGWGKLVICPSRVIARHMIDDFGVPLERIKLVPRSVDVEKFKYCDPGEKRKMREFNVGIVGRITPLKGHIHFIKAMAKVARSIPELKVWIVGDVPASKEAYKEELQVLVRRLGLAHCTQFLGTQRDIPGILRHLDLVVLASTTHDAFPRSVVEAQASGVPVVGTAVGGVIDIIEDGKTGLLVPAADPASIAEAALKIFNDPGFASTIAREALIKVKEKYTAEHLVKNTLEVYKEATESFRLLVIKLSSLGDIILSTAAIRALREKYKSGYKITFLVGEESKEVLLRCPYIDELMVADLKERDRGLKALFKIGTALRKKNFDIVIDLQNNRKSHILSFLAYAPSRYGYDNKKFGFLLNHRIPDEKPLMDPVEHQFRILKMLGIGLANPHLELWPTEEECRFSDEMLSGEWLASNQKIVGINISASPRWMTKCWPRENLIRLCEELGRRGIRIVLTGTQKDVTSAEYLTRQLKDIKLINACAKTTINQLACLIRRCNVYVSADSSPLHVAAAMDTPFVALFGPTDPRRHLPPVKDFTVIKKDLICSPCYKPRCRDAKCMGQITADEVLRAVEELLAL
ncbi:MAG: lipopolysaccharide heptosyltransferase II [Candidatus Omnitrophica bacterium]|nr:lipopolysaccharide heptosyltransferase II [Candidatus Omnitrophota bacterium]